MSKHPSHYIPGSAVTIIRQQAADAEKMRQLHPAQLDLIYQHNWFNLFVPKTYGGLEHSLPEALAIEEALAWADGSLGWTVTLCSGANFFIGFLEPEASTSIFSTPKVCLAGSGHPSGIAVRTKNGYTISGRWQYATGAPHATVFTASCIIEEEGKQLQDKKGQPLVEAFWFYRDEVALQDDWHTIGMIATASRSFEIQQLEVPAHRRFIIDATHAQLPQPVFRYPFLPFAEATLAVNSSGMALHFLELAQEIIDKKQLNNKIVLQQTLKINTARAVFFEAAHRSWEELIRNQVIQQKTLHAVSRSSRRLAKTAWDLVDILYRCCGITAASPASEINLVWRDMHTASQHRLLACSQGITKKNLPETQ